MVSAEIFREQIPAMVTLHNFRLWLDSAAWTDAPLAAH